MSFLSLSLGMCSHFLFFCIHAVVFLNVLVFSMWLPKREKQKVKGDKMGHQPFKSPGSNFSWREKGLQQWWEVQQWLPTSADLCDQKQQSEHRSPIFEGWFFFFYPPKLLQSVCKLFQKHLHSCLPCGCGWRMGTYLCAKISN